MVKALDPQTIEVQWRPPPPHAINGILQGYKVRYEEEETHESFWKIVMSPAISTRLSLLKTFTMYKISVMAFTDAGNGVASEPLLKRTLEDSE